MAAEAFRPITTLQEPSLQGMPRTYTSIREVAAETGAPVRGSVLGPILGPQFATHIVLDASIQPKDGKRILTVSHCPAPDWAILHGSEDRGGGDGEHLYSQQVIPTPSPEVIEADHLSTYQPIDEAKTLKRTKRPRRKKADGTYEDGYPKKQVKSLGVEDLTPSKYKSQTVTVTTTTTEALPAANVDNIPAPAFPDPRGDVTKIEHQKINDDQYQVTVEEEIIGENTADLTGEEYGDIVTAKTSEALVPDGSLADTGIDVLSSRVAPLGNGKSIKTTTKVKGGIWPDPVEEEKSKDVPDLIPPKFRSSVARRKTTRKVSSIPSVITLTGDQTARSFKRETPHRVEETVVTEELESNPLAILGGQTSEWGVLKTQERLVPEKDVGGSQTPVPIGEGIAEARIQPYGNGKAEEMVSLFPSANPSTGVIATLSDQDQDPENRVITDIQRSLVVNSKASAYVNSMRASGWFVERKGRDQHHSLLICSKIDKNSLPADEVFWDHDSISLPDTLLGVSPVFSTEAAAGSGSGETYAKASASSGADATVHVSIAGGFNGRTAVKVTRKFINGPPTTLFVAPISIQPSIGTVAVTGGQNSVAVSISKGGSSDNKSIATSAKAVRIGPVMSGGYSASWRHVSPTGQGGAWVRSSDFSASVSAQSNSTATVSVSIPASSGLHSDLVSRYQVAKKWRLDVWVVEIVEVFYPNSLMPQTAQSAASAAAIRSQDMSLEEWRKRSSREALLG